VPPGEVCAFGGQVQRLTRVPGEYVGSGGLGEHIVSVRIVLSFPSVAPTTV
jgi:hypothetical protein